MTAVLAAELPPPDICPSCAIPDPSLPLGDLEDVDGGTLASYQCGSCGMAWQTLFDAHWWVVDRLAAPVAEALESAAAEGQAA